MSLRPSSLPAIAASPCWEPAGIETDGMSAGTARHKVLADALMSEFATPESGAGIIAASDLETEDAEGVAWAFGYINTVRNSEMPLEIEARRSLLNEDFQEILSGTPDIVCGADVFDLKWRQADYNAQLAAYALMVMEDSGLAEVRIHVLYAASQYSDVYRITLDEARATVFGIIDRQKALKDQPTPSSYCGRCAKQIGCPAFTAAVQAVAMGYAEELDAVKEWHPSKMETPEELDRALYIWRTIVKKWGESVEYHAKQRAVVGAVALPRFEVKTKAGSKWVTSAAAAFGVCMLPQAEFLGVCEVRLETSKKTNRVGLFDIYKKFHGLTSKAAAKREALKKLSDANLIGSGGPSEYLALRAGDTEETTEEKEQDNASI